MWDAQKARRWKISGIAGKYRAKRSRKPEKNDYICLLSCFQIWKVSQKVRSRDYNCYCYYYRCYVFRLRYLRSLC
jgi:hypothetical protein